MMAKDKDFVLNNYLHGDSGLSRVYAKAGEVTPPASLDTTILAASRRAVGSRPQLATSPFSRTWAIPASIAAVLMLSVGLINFMDEQEVNFDEMSYIPKLRGGIERNQSKDASGIADTDKPASKPNAKSASGLRRSLRIVPQAPAPQTPPASSQVSPGLARSFELMEAEAVRESKLKKSMAVQEEVASQPGAYDTEMGALMQKRSQSEDRALIQEKLKRTPDAISPARKRVPYSDSHEYDGVSRTGKIEGPTAALDTWLEYIRKLQRDGRIEEAKASFKAFRQRYPEYPVTDEYEGLK
ncbi:MAG TPA: hypothetical protein ENI80_09795 [Acidiferrobacteraceae bacterium]|nr:hypothetical protein [Acidiferrobacteraceae bacterium]